MNSPFFLNMAGLLGIGFLSLSAADWPQWRGPERDSISPETGLLQEWPAAGPKLVWQAKNLGSGYSSPVVVGDHIFVLGNEGLDDEFVQALSVKSGDGVWRTRLGKVGNPDQRPNYPGSRSTATVDGDRLYALGSDGDLACLDKATGKILWQKNLRGDFGGKPGRWAYSESPLIDGNALICTPGGSEATLLALDKRTGAVIWKCAIPEADEAAYASIVTMMVDGQKQYVQFLQKGVVGVDANTGRFLWRYEKTAENSPANMPTPIVHEDYVYTAAGRSGGGLVKVSSSGDSMTATPVYFSPQLPKDIGGSVLVGKHLFGTSGPTLQCVEFLTGNVVWDERSIGASSICYADGRLYLKGESGDMALVASTTTGYEEKGRFTLPNQPDRGRAKAWAYPVIANGKLYLRDMNMLWCYDVQASQSL